MKKKPISLFAVIILAMMLCACSKTEKPAEINNNFSVNSNNEENANSSVNSSNEENGNSYNNYNTIDYSLLTRLISNPDDAVYFNPASDDYIYLVDYAEGDSSSNMTLMSFDASGNLIQYVTRKGLMGDISSDKGFTEERRKAGEYFGTPVLSADTTVLYIDELDFVMRMSNNHFRTDKFYYTDKFYRNDCDEDSFIYMSKKPDNISTALDTNCNDMKWLEELKTVASEFGSDYYIRAVIKDTLIHEPEYFTYENEKILKCGEYALDTCVIFIFDENGQAVKTLNVNVVSNEEQVSEFLYSQMDVSLDYEKRERSVNASELQQFYEIYTIKGNIIYSQRESTSDYKWSPNFISNPKYYYSYFSVPFLTEKQIDKYYSEVFPD